MDLRVILKMNEKPKSKSKLPGITIKGQIIPSTEVSEVTQKKVNYTSTNGPPRNHYGTLKTKLKTCAKGTKLRVYTVIENGKVNCTDICMLR